MADSLESLESLHRRAQAHLGLIAAYLSLSSWPASKDGKMPKLDGWADYVAAQVVELRDIARDLTITYYQLARWIETGSSLGAPLDGDDTPDGLTNAFLSRVQAVADLRDSQTDIGDDIRSAMRRRTSEIQFDSLQLQPYIDEFTKDFSVPSGRVNTDSFTWPVLARDEKALRTIAKSLITSASKDTERRLSLAEKAEQDSARILQEANDIVNGASKKGATGADKHVMDTSRGIAEYAHRRDKRVRLYARGTSGNPCAFCAMLASRGFVYWSETSAMRSYRDGGMRSYHPNCKCFPIVRWSETSKLPELNQYFQDMWPEVTDGYSGNDALNAWRRWLNQKRRESRSGNRTNNSQEENK